MIASLPGRLQATLDALFTQPIARHLYRRDVTALLHALAEVREEQNGDLHATRRGQSLHLHSTRDRNLAASAELVHIRDFLKRSGVPNAAD